MLPMKTPAEFRERAAECERLAAEVTDPTIERTLLFVAARWRSLAKEDEDSASRYNPRRS
ncbi:MAG: hypothetical protein JWL84_4643 [Rhodospirillales bacterium]|jgi:hypothetical protein|nr:hypothetical protein [Rhodospirillales bacterium]